MGLSIPGMVLIYPPIAGRKMGMRSVTGAKLKRFTRDDGTSYLSADTTDIGTLCPFCGSKDIRGGSWAPDTCVACGAVYHMGWVREESPSAAPHQDKPE